MSLEEFYTRTTGEIGEKIGWKDVGYGLERLYEIANRGEFFPKTAIFVANEDELVGPTGGHGFADGCGMCMEGWPKRAIEWFETK